MSVSLLWFGVVTARSFLVSAAGWLIFRKEAHPLKQAVDSLYS